MGRISPLALGFLSRHPADCARILEELPEKTSCSLLGAISPELTADIAGHMVTSYASRCLHSFDAAKAALIIKKMSMPKAARLLRAMPAEKAETITDHLPSHLKNNIRSALKYPDRTVGKIMDANPFSLPESITVNSALKRIKDLGDQPLNEIFVVDDNHTLKGVVYVSNLLAAPKTSPLRTIINNVPFLTTSTALASAALHAGWQSFSTLPVAGKEHVLSGVLKSSTLLQVLAETQEGGKPPDLLDEALLMTRMYWVTMVELVNAVAGGIQKGAGENNGKRP